MNIIQTLRTALASNASLLALLPLRRIITAPAPAHDSQNVPFTAAAAPYLIVEEGLLQRTLRTNTSRYYNSTYTFRIRADQYSKARAIRDLLLEALPDAVAGALSLGGIYDFELENCNYLCEDTDPTLTVHHYILTFHAHVTISRSSSGS